SEEEPSAVRRFSKRLSFSSPSPRNPSSYPSYPPTSKSRSHTLRKIHPAKCTGELALHSLSFAYPSRPSVPVLRDVSLYLPAREMTFIVGASGSGKSTVAQVLLGMYHPKVRVNVGGGADDDNDKEKEKEGFVEGGVVLLDEQDMRYLDDRWVRQHVVGVGQQGAAGVVILEGRSVWENVLVGMRESEWLLGFSSSAASPTSSKNTKDKSKSKHTKSQSKGKDTTQEPTTHASAPYDLRLRVESAARTAMLLEFIRDLPQGWDTILGENGVGLSGGQKQRLALARAVLRDPEVLILDEPTSALDPPTRLLVFAALKARRQGKTTVVITHDLSQIAGEDFVYVMRGGRVVEGGYRCDLEREPLVVAGGGGEGGEQEQEQDQEQEQEGDGEDESTRSDAEGPKRTVKTETTSGRGEFRKLLEAQTMMEGGAPEATEEPGTPFPFAFNPKASSRPAAAHSTNHHEEDEEEYEDESEDEEGQIVEIPTQQTLASLRPLSWGNWMFEVVADLVGNGPSAITNTTAPSNDAAPSDGNDDLEKGYALPTKPQPAHKYQFRRPRSISILRPSAAAAQSRGGGIPEDAEVTTLTDTNTLEWRFDGTPLSLKTPRSKAQRRSLQFVPSSPSVASSYTAVNRSSALAFAGVKGVGEEKTEWVYDEREFEDEKRVVERSGLAVNTNRARVKRQRTRWDSNEMEMTSVRVVGEKDVAN
ncbi:hypothetical protein CVT26_000277, partial [Gymnopilus dilepis]